MKWLAARAAAFPARLQDLALAVALAIVNVVIVLPYRSDLHPLAVAMVLLVAQAVPLIWRRSWPVAVFLAAGLPRSLYDQLGFGYAPVPLGPAIAYYTVMARCSARTRWVISVVLLAGILHSQALPGHNEPYDFFVAALIFAAAGMLGILSRTRQAYLAEVESRMVQADARREQEIALAAAGERTRIARELHDVVAHHVSLMAVQAEAAGSLLPGRPDEAAQSVQVIGDTARQALTELRRLLGVLRGPAEPAQTAPASSLGELDRVLTQVRGAGLAVDLRVEGRPCQLAQGVDLAVFRIVQEALTNALRHADASQATVTLSYEPGYVTVSVTDSGASPSGQSGTGDGPDRARHAAEHGPGVSAGTGGTGGFGLAGIAERVASCRGSLTMGPTGLGGFAVTARLPAQ